LAIQLARESGAVVTALVLDAAAAGEPLPGRRGRLAFSVSDTRLIASPRSMGQPTRRRSAVAAQRSWRRRLPVAVPTGSIVIV
jgi:hypothetical protein